MKNFYFVGDLHLNDVNPRSRIDDYSIAILDKLTYIFNLAKENNIEAIFFLGDIFHKPSGLSTKYLNKVISTFQLAPCPCYSIIGNHDIPFNKIDEVDNTSLGILFKSRALVHLDNYPITPNISIFGFDYNTDISYITKPSTCSLGICISHSYGEDVSFGDNEKAEYFKWSKPNESPFDVYILGHDHSYHSSKKIYNNSYLYRVGALSRVTSASSDVQRDIKILEVNIDTQNISYDIKEVNIPYTPSLECFSQQSLNKISTHNSSLDGSLEDILSNLNFNIQSSIFDIIDEMNLDSKIVELLETYLKNNFITRKEISHESLYNN